MDPIHRRTRRSVALNGAPVTLREATAGANRIFDVLYPARLTLPRHDHDHRYLCLVVSGDFEESWSGRGRRGQVGSFFYYPDQLAHRGRYGDRGARVLHVEIPGNGHRSICVGASDASVPRDDLRDSPAAGLAWQLLHELQLVGSRAELDDLMLESLVSDLLAGVFGTAPRPRRDAPAWLRTVEEILRSQRGPAPGLSVIAAEVGRHPSHLAREYRRHTGLTLGQRARRLQVARAAATIAGSELPLTQVAHEAGFADQSHMGRAFKALMGMTPATYKREVSGR